MEKTKLKIHFDRKWKFSLLNEKLEIKNVNGSTDFRPDLRSSATE